MSTLPKEADRDDDSIAERSERLDPRAIADLTIDLIESFHCRPTPKAYEVFYAYAANSIPALRAEVDAAAGEEHILRSYDLDQIYHRHFRSADGEWERQEQSSEAVEMSLIDALGLIEQHLKTGASYGSKLKSACTEIAEAENPDKLRKIVTDLIEENDAQQKAHAAFSSTLADTRINIEKVREDLASAREDGLTDPLSGLGNRRNFEAALEREIKSAIANGNQLALCLIDVDRFDEVTKGFEPSTGDAVLRYLGQMIPHSVGPGGKAYRFGGDEFAVLMPGRGVAAAFASAQDIRRQIERKRLRVSTTGQELGKITASFGLAMLSGSDGSEALLERAEEMLAGAKSRGGNKVASDTRPTL